MAIRRGASQLARAFRTLGAFGTSARHDASTGGESAVVLRPSTYADLSRKYAPLLISAGGGAATATAPHPPRGGGSSGRGGSSLDVGVTGRFEGGGGGGVLDALVSASARAAAGGGGGGTPWSLLEAAYEGSVPDAGRDGAGAAAASSDPPPNAGGRRANGRRKTAAWTTSGPGRRAGGGTDPAGVDDAASADGDPTHSGDIPGSSMLIGAGGARGDADSSDAHDAATVLRAARSSRRLMSLRIEASEQRRSAETSMLALRRSTSSLAARGPVYPLEQQFGDDPESNNLRRVVVQLDRSAQVLHSRYSSAAARVAEAEVEAGISRGDLASVRGRCRAAHRRKVDEEPPSLRQILGGVESDRRDVGFGAKARSPGRNNIAMSAVFTRQYRGRRQSSSADRTRLSVLKSRLSHAATISGHLIYPVYCLKFDRTGKYFITGADDQVAKIFRLGVGKKSCRSGGDRSYAALNYGANVRGAILVCSLRGHAGVVADIDVSSDNSLLATASGDGDIRVWGLKDGWPVAILRGHKGGANMVSVLTALSE